MLDVFSVSYGTHKNDLEYLFVWVVALKLWWMFSGVSKDY